MARYEVIIVGGGLAGLALADLLARQGIDFALLEARSRLGGRIKSDDAFGAMFDLGPSWFWPSQPRMEQMVERFNLSRFDQYAAGELSFEDERGQVQRGVGFSSMQGSYRLQGGVLSLISALAEAVPNRRILTDQVVTKIVRATDGVVVETEHGAQFQGQRVVLALPPRIAATFQYEPFLNGDALQAMQDVSTWMAGQAKAVAVYDTPFWRDIGLSGDAMSRRGPMVEMHDASTDDGQLGAIFGFIGVPASARQDQDALRRQICDQLGRLFGPEATRPKSLLLKDWAWDRLTATPQDHAPLHAHPRYGMPSALSRLWDGRIVFGGTEVALTFGGYLEGALEAADQAFAILKKQGIAA